MKDTKTLALVGCDADERIFEALAALEFCVQILPTHTSLPSPVSSHADMLIFELDGNIFAEKRYVEKNKEVFGIISAYGYNVVSCDVSLGSKYPHDIAFNIAVCGKTLYGNIKNNAQDVIEFAQSKNFKFTAIKQGYAKCSTVILRDKAIITADEGIANAASANGVSVLKIRNSPDSVELNGYNYGFIGGACGVFENNIYFSGNIDLHPEGKIIRDFCESLGYNTICLTDSKLVDIGGIIFLPYRS